MKEIFTKIYRDNKWMSAESVSGQGSELTATTEILQKLPDIFKKYDIKSLLDLGCGDLNWMSQIIFYLDNYVGVDVVDKIISKNIVKYQSLDTVKFICEDIQKYDGFNDFDAILLKDVLVHFSFNDIRIILDKIKKGNSSYLLTTSFLAETRNDEIQTGTWRRLNMLLPPFYFPPPIETIVSYSEPYRDIKGYRCFDKTLSMWNIDDIKRCCPS